MRSYSRSIFSRVEQRLLTLAEEVVRLLPETNEEGGVIRCHEIARVVAECARRAAGKPVLVEVYMLFWTVAFSTKYMFLAWNRILRSRNIRAQGWPPAHLDGDGDAVKHELGEARVLPFVGNEIEAQHPTNDQWVAVLVSFYRSVSSFQVVSLDGLEGWEVDVSGPRWRWPARPASARGSS